MRNSSMSCAGICAFPATSRSETTMFNLKEYRSSNTRLADFLPWAALVGDGVVLNKDGSLQRSARFRGPDLDSAVPAELVAVASRSEERRVGKECVSTCRSRGSPQPSKKNTKHNNLTKKSLSKN